MRVVVVSHALTQDAARARWRRLAERHPVEVTLLVPEYWRSGWFGTAQEWRVAPVEESRFRVRPLPTTAPGDWCRYLFRSLDADLRELRPDVIYVVQEEVTFVLQQMLLYRSLWARSAKLAFFSWNNLRVPTHSWRARLAWSRVCAQADAAIAGTTEIRDVLSSAGFTRPIHLQTEIGVDEQRFFPDAALREQARRRLGVNGFVVGFAGRLVEEKGVLDLARALGEVGGEWTALVVGDGVLRPEIDRVAREQGWHERLVFTGHAELDEMPEHIRAMDCLVLPSRTVPGWKEQFGLVLAQAMASGVPVIGSDSGAIPEVIGDAGLIFHEGDVGALRDSISRLVEDEDERAKLARRGLERALALYSASGLADQSYSLFRSLLSG